LPQSQSALLPLIEHVDGTLGNTGLLFFGALNDDAEEGDDFTASQIELISPILPVHLDVDFNSSTSETSDVDYKIQVAMEKTIEAQKTNNRASSNILVRDIAWTSCPLISKRMQVEKKVSTTQIIESIDGIYSLLSEWDLSAQGGGRVIAYSVVLNGYNKPFVLWPYFNYLMYVSVFHVKADFSDDNMNSYAEWPYAPIPHGIEIVLWFLMIGVLWVVTIYFFLKMKKKAKAFKEMPIPAKEAPTA
jgi:hypothetical protein